jgi:hypothetical protein
MTVLIRDAGKPPPPCPLPAWARASDARMDSADCALFAGAALSALDPIVRASAPFAGVWRQRLALRAATATVHMAGRREAEADLRDAWFLRARGAALGPAGEHLQAWRMLASNSTLSLGGLQRAALCFGLSVSVPLTAILALTERSDGNPVRAAAQTAAAVASLNPAAEFLALWLADFVLARRLRWPQPVPLLAAKISDPAIRRAANARTSHPEDESWEKVVALAYAQAAASAIDLAGDLSRRADKLLSQRAKLRAKGAGKVVDRLLEDDAFAPSARIGGMSDRGMRRIVDRLVTLGVARELTDRPTFRLYGL